MADAALASADSAGGDTTHGPRWLRVRPAVTGGAGAKNAAVDAVLRAGLVPAAFVFLHPSDRLRPEFLAACERVLARCPEVGVVSCWTHGAATRLRAAPCPSFPYQWLWTDAAPVSAVRREAFLAAGALREPLADGYELWDLCNAALAAGWSAVTIPEPLAELGAASDRILRRAPSSRLRRVLALRHPELLAADAQEILALAHAPGGRFLQEGALTPHELVAVARALWRAGAGAARRALGRPGWPRPR